MDEQTIGDGDLPAGGPDEPPAPSSGRAGTSSRKVSPVLLAIVGLVVLSVVVAAALVLFGSDDDDGPGADAAPTTTEAPPSTQLSAGFTIAELLPLDGQYATFLDLADQSGVLDELDTEEELTLLVPNVEAFDEVDVAAVESDPDALAALLRRHVLTGALTLSDLLAQDGSTVTNLDGDELTVEVGENVVSVGGAQVVKSNIQASNGVIHVTAGIVAP